MAEQVKVAVRVRPFNDRERNFKTSLIIDMKGNQTYIKDPNNPQKEPRTFAFDYSYWSHDGFKKPEQSDGYIHPANEKYADQRHGAWQTNFSYV